MVLMKLLRHTAEEFRSKSIAWHRHAALVRGAASSGGPKTIVFRMFWRHRHLTVSSAMLQGCQSAGRFLGQSLDRSVVSWLVGRLTG